MLEEAGLPYEHVLVDWAQGESRTPEFLAINPNGKIPVLTDGDLRLFESLAINYHIARHYAPALWVDDPREESVAIQWLAWGLAELEGPHDAANRDGSSVNVERLDVSLDVLRQTLSRQPYLLGDKFTVVDLNTAALLLRPQYRKFVRDDPQLCDWFSACTTREALDRAITPKS